MFLLPGPQPQFPRARSGDAEPLATANERNFETYTPRVVAVRIDEDDAPVIDGDLSDLAWLEATPINEFYQIEPVEGVTPSQPTLAYVVYDRKNLYVGIYAYDSEPDLITRNQLQRDPRLRDDDGLRIFIDSNGTFRDSYFFGMNANGARVDALTENASTFRPEWNTIWRGKARVVDDGWIAEFAIPFQSISFDSSLDEWNMQIIRTIRRNNEEIRWSNIDQSRGRIDLTNPGRLAGIEDISSGIGLEVQAFVTGASQYNWETDDFDFSLDPSGNAFYKITDSLTGSLTINTDFSDTGLDARQVNTGRFSLFFPETRDFFLQDAAVFEFGGRVFQDNPNGLPFFSRNIGVVDGQPVDIVAGAKLSGKLGPANVGLISTRTGSADGLGIDGQYLSSARVSIPVLAESKVGLVLTNGDPSGMNKNTVGGADFQYKLSNLFGEGTLFSDVAYVRSFAENGDDDEMFGMETAYRSQSWNATFRFRDIGEDYAPTLGFVNRTGIRRYTANAWRTFRPANSFIRFAETGMWTNIITDLNDRRIDHFYGGWMGGQNNDGDEAWAEYEHGYLDIIRPFSIAGVVPVATGEYRWSQYEVRFGTSQGRPFAVRAGYRWGGVYDGDYDQINTSLILRPSKHLEFSVDHDFLKFDLPSGEVGIHITAIDSTIAFSPDMRINTEIQYDNISDGFTFFSRFVWEPVPEREIFLSLGHSALIESTTFPRDFRSQGTSMALRLGHTFRM